MADIAMLTADHRHNTKLLKDLKRQLGNVRQKLRRAQAQGGDMAVVAARLRRDVDKLVKKRDITKAALANILIKIVQWENRSRAYSNLERAPAALLPVRIETRFRRMGARHELRVRIFPDDIHVDTHESELTAEEAAAGKEHLDYLQNGRGDESWAALVAQFGAERAAWVVQASHAGQTAGRETSWTRAPLAEALPERFLVVGYHKGAKVFESWGKAIRRPLQVGPDPAADDVDEARKGLRWLEDYDEAISVGMAVTIPLTSAQWQAGFDQIFVVGVNTGINASDGAQAFEALLSAHRFTDGLHILPAGKPTNRRGQEPPKEVTLPSTSIGSDSQRIARALGISSQVFAGTPGGAGGTDAAKAMAEAVWPSTWGYYFRHMLSTSDKTVAAVRSHFIRWVRAGGDLPMLRIGAQPYGIVPISDYDDDSTREISAVLRLLRPQWVKAFDKVPRVNSDAQSLLDALAMDARSTRYVLQQFLGEESVAALTGQSTPAHNQWSHSAQKTVVQQYHLQTSRLVRGYFGSTIGDLQTPLVYGDHPESEPLPDFFYEPLLDSNASRFADRADLANPKRRTLYYAMLRQGLLTMLSDGLRTVTPAPAMDHWREREFAEKMEDTMFGPLHSNRFLDWTRGSLQLSISGRTRVELAAYENALDTLKSVSKQELEHLFGSALDACSHRLDAWLTSLSMKAIDHVRDQDLGLHVGAYGWVEDIRPRRQGPVSAGYIAAPSPTHAASAAVLQSGQMQNRKEFAVDLSASRVRVAYWLHEGVAQGQRVGALLGYRIERQIVEANAAFAQYLEALRVLAPTVGDLTNNDVPQEVVAARNVVDGKKLLAAQEAGIPWGQQGLPASGTAAMQAIDEAIQQAASALDALGDLLLAEGVHQAAQGNLDRAAGALEAMSGGSMPDTFDVVDTPRRATAHEHRLVIGMVERPSAWPSTPASLADPLLNGWLEAQLPAPDRVVVRVTRPDGATSDHTMDSLGFAPIDLMRLHASSHLNDWVCHRTGAEAVDPQPATAQTPLGNVLDVLENLAPVVAASRSLALPDLVGPDQEPTDGVDASELNRRVHAVLESLQSAHGALAGANSLQAVPPLVPGPPPDDVAQELERLQEKEAILSSAGNSVDDIRAAFNRVLGALPIVTVLDVPPAIFTPIRESSNEIQGQLHGKLGSWLAGIGRARPAVGSLEIARLAVQGNGQLAVSQLPHAAGDAWVADPDGVTGTTAKTVITWWRLPTTPRMGGLRVDSWQESHPEPEHDAAAAIHFDAPGSRAPNAILLVAPPRTWSSANVIGAVREALQLAKIRAVDAESLQGVGHMLPAIFLSQPSTDQNYSIPPQILTVMT